MQDSGEELEDEQYARWEVKKILGQDVGPLFVYLVDSLVDRKPKEVGPYFVYPKDGKPRHYVSRLTEVLGLIDRGVIDAENIISLTVGEVSRGKNGWVFTYDRTEYGAVILNRSPQLGPFRDSNRCAVKKTANRFKRVVNPFVLILMNCL